MRRALGSLFGGLARLRAAAYRRGLLPRDHPEGPVVSVGNLSVGGSGKTPVVRRVAATAEAAEKQPAALQLWRQVKIATAGLAAAALLGVHAYLFCSWMLPGAAARVHLAITGLLVQEPDMVISGINKGANTGNHILYSGTVSAAVEAAKAGYKSTIVEKSGALGGAAANAWKRIPQRAPYADPEDTGVAELIAAVEASDKITVHLNSTVAKTAGDPAVPVVDGRGGVLDGEDLCHGADTTFGRCRICDSGAEWTTPPGRATCSAAWATRSGFRPSSRRTTSSTATLVVRIAGWLLAVSLSSSSGPSKNRPTRTPLI